MVLQQLLMNADKSHLLVTNHLDDIFVNVGREVIKCEKSVKLLGIKIDNKLDFSEQVSALCKKSKLKVTCSSENLELYEYTET